MNIKTIKDELIDEFSMFDDWMERYEYMIELGKSLPIIDSEFKTGIKRLYSMNLI